VNDSHAVSGLQGTTCLPHNLDHVFGGQFMFLVENAPKILPLDILHGDELDPIDFSEVMDPYDVLVGNLTRENEFLLEPFDDVIVAGQIRTNDFQSHQLAHLSVSSLVDLSHAALSEELQDLVALA